jgi:hypothetical protein
MLSRRWQLWKEEWPTWMMQRDDASGMWSEIRCGRTWWRRPMRGDGRASGIASTATRPDSWTTVRWRCRAVGGNACNRLKPKRSWRRCGPRCSAAPRLENHPGKTERRSDWVCNPAFVRAAGHTSPRHKNKDPLFEFKRGAGGSRTHDGGFAIRCLSHLATAPSLEQTLLLREAEHEQDYVAYTTYSSQTSMTPVRSRGIVCGRRLSVNGVTIPGVGQPSP